MNPPTDDNYRTVFGAPVLVNNEIHFTSPTYHQPLKLCLGDGVLFSTYAQFLKNELPSG